MSYFASIFRIVKFTLDEVDEASWSDIKAREVGLDIAAAFQGDYNSLAFRFIADEAFLRFSKCIKRLFEGSGSRTSFGRHKTYDPGRAHNGPAAFIHSNAYAHTLRHRN